MTSHTRLVRIFLASPGDVGEEREALVRVVQELDRTLGVDHNLNLKLVRWETDAWPGFGEDGQDVINREIGEYDIFVGVMWKRLGTPTGRASSGTAEEFDRAFARWQHNGIPKLLFYFSQKAFPPAEASQVNEVLAFKKSLQTKGGLYWDYTTLQEFESRVREHLYKELRASFEQETQFAGSSPLDTGVLDMPDASSLVCRRGVVAELEGHFDSQSLIVVEGLRGSGKTSVVSYALDRTGRSRSTLWVDAEKGATLDDVLSLLESRVTFKSGSTPTRAKELVHHCVTHDCCLVIDDYQDVVEESFQPLIKAAGRVKSQVGLILVSRRRIEHASIVVKPCRVVIDGLSSEEIVAILNMRGVESVPERWVNGLIEQVGGLPIAVTLFATAVKEFGRDGDELLSGSLFGDGLLKQWFEDIVADISESSRGLLRFLSVAEGAFGRSVVRAGGKHAQIAKVNVSFEVLQRAHLVQRYSQDRWCVHQLIGALALAELSSSQRQAIHEVYGEHYLRRIVEWPKQLLDSETFAISVAACRHLQAAGRHEQSQSLLSRLARTAKARGHFATFRQLCHSELDVPDHDPWLDYHYAHCCLLIGRLCEAAEAIRRANALSVESSLRLSLARLHAECLDVAGHPRRALSTLLAAIDALGGEVDANVMEQANGVLSRVYLAAGNGQRATATATKQLAQARSARHNIGIAVGSAALGFARLSMKDPIAAKPPLDEALKLFERAGDRRGASWALSGVARVARARGDLAEARSAVGSVVRTRSDLTECSAEYLEFLLFAQEVWPHGPDDLIDDEIERVGGLLESERRAFIARNLHVLA